ncbi:MAG: hypothetical protein ABEI74_04720 [Candidatus Pacearchaeota archaeon]
MKKLRYTMITPILLILLVGFASAGISDLGTFKKNEDVQLIQVCNCSSANITKILSPNGSTISINSAMTKKGTFFNYTLDSNFTNQIGTYKVNGEGIIDGKTETFSYSFTITTSGGELQEGQGTLYIGLLFVLLVFFGVSLYLTITTPFGNIRNEAGELAGVNYNKYTKFVYGFLTYISLMFIMFTGKGITGQYAAMDTAYTLFNVGSTIMIVALGPLLIAMTFFIALNLMSDKKNIQALKRGLPTR